MLGAGNIQGLKNRMTAHHGANSIAKPTLTPLPRLHSGAEAAHAR